MPIAKFFSADPGEIEQIAPKTLMSIRLHRKRLMMHETRGHGFQKHSAREDVQLAFGFEEMRSGRIRGYAEVRPISDKSLPRIGFERLN